MPLHQDRIAMPADVARVDPEQPVGVPARLVEDTLVLHPEVNGLVHSVAVDELMRNRGPAPAKAFVGLLQGDDVGVDLAQHVENAPGIALAVEPDRLAHVVGRESDGWTAHSGANSRSA